MRNPFARLPRRDTARPSLKERAAGLKASAARVMKRRPVRDAATPDAPSPALVGMVAEWERLLRAENAGDLPDDEIEPICSKRMALHGLICTTPAASLADLATKLPLFRDEVANSAPGTADKPTLDHQAWCCIVRDLETVGAVPNPALAPASLPIPAGDVDGSGFVAYEDAAGHVHRRPIAEWVAYSAMRLIGIATDELARQFNAASNADPDQDANALHDRLRRELRIDALHDLAFRSDRVFAASREYAVGHRWRVVGDDADAELLALGREFDAIHAEWVPAAIAQERAEAKALALYRDLKDRRGWTPAEAYEASWAEPGLSEVVDRGDTVTGRMDGVQKAIIALPARTHDGLAVKARAAIPAFWSRGQYEQDAGLGDEEDWVEQNARSVIDECLHVAGVDWTGRRWQPAPSVGETAADLPSLTPKASAGSVDLSGLGINELRSLYEITGAAREIWGAAMGAPLAVARGDAKHGTATLTAFGNFAENEDSRLGFLRDRLVTEAEGRTPTDERDRDNRLGLSIRHELACEGRIRAPALLAEIAQAWGTDR